MAEVILVFPHHDIESIVIPRFHIPLSVLCLGTYLKKAGVDVKLIDQRVSEDWQKDLREHLTTETLCLGISSMTGTQIDEGLKIAKFAKGLHPELPIVWGGIHPSLMPEQTLENRMVDAVVIGEGEKALKNLVAALKNGKPLSQVSGIAYMENGSYRYTGIQDFIDPHHILQLSYELLDMREYIEPAEGNGRPSLVTVTSRGCPYSCSFCYHSGLREFKKLRFCRPERVIRHLEFLNEAFQVDTFIMIDDNFFVNKERVLDLITGLRRTKHEFNIYNSNLRADNALMYTTDEWKYLRDGGVDFVFLGAESGSDNVLKAINKGFEVQHILKANQLLRQAGVRSAFSFMIGLPDEEMEDTMMTLKLMDRIMQENPLSTVNFSIFCPFPGTRSYERCLELGMQFPRSLEGWRHHIANRVTFDRLDPNHLKFLEKIKGWSVMIDYKQASLRTRNPIIRFFIRIYSKVLRFRVNHDFYRIMLESFLLNLAKNPRHRSWVRILLRLK